ncbi:hypothetical protein SAMN06313486_10177 [Epsilonproteobacteria bacterium SCGC AD-308-P11]|jgi:post-segregation antitoxin (ccd killing protein)|nr:hypothetical protein SAMN06313486_10177 [Epsilonproteobacteria bacterium SCGC AD-308-P11]
MVLRQEKITITIPTQIKNEVVKLKKDLKVSMNSIYQTAIQEYVKQKKREKLRIEAQSMVEEYKTNPERIELAEFEEDVVEY